MEGKKRQKNLGWEAKRKRKKRDKVSQSWEVKDGVLDVRVNDGCDEKGLWMECGRVSTIGQKVKCEAPSHNVRPM